MSSAETDNTCLAIVHKNPHPVTVNDCRHRHRHHHCHGLRRILGNVLFPDKRQSAFDLSTKV